jgi:putative ABC transport system substrate-binding protein
MRRRELLVLLGGSVSAARGLHAQQKAMPVVGFLGISSPALYEARLDAFRQGLSEIGRVDGQNLTIEYRWAEGRYDRLLALAAELVGRKVNAIVATASPAALAAKAATPTIPIVFVAVADPVAAGLAASLARPGGNITGISTMSIELMPKRLELLCELVPQAKVIALLVNPNNYYTERIIADAQEAARAKGVVLQILKAGVETEIDSAFASLHQLGAGALLVGADPFFANRREQLVAMPTRHAVPAISEFREFAEGGGLISYGPSIIDTYRQAGMYLGRILEGERPADLPVQQPTTFELVVNLKTATALGLTVPPSILARADEVIE